MFIADGGIVILLIRLVNSISAKNSHFDENDVSPVFQYCSALFLRHAAGPRSFCENSFSAKKRPQANACGLIKVLFMFLRCCETHLPALHGISR